VALSSYPHSGYRYAYLGDLPGHVKALGSVHQIPVTIPANAITATLTFWLNITTAEANGAAYDFMEVNIRRIPDDSLIRRERVYSNLNSSITENVPGDYRRQSIDLLAYKGQSFTLQFYVDTDFSNATLFRIDGVSLLADGS